MVSAICFLKMGVGKSHHGPEFYALLERTLPDWAVRKRKLEAALA